MDFTTQLRSRWQHHASALCVGLDPDPNRYPAPLIHAPDRALQFCRAIVDATADLVCAFKPQIAHFAAQRAEDQLEALIEHIHTAHPGVPVILDAKRGDIGSTAQMYAREAFERYRADAVTVNPYLGFDSLQPYLDYVDRGVIVLCRTSNPGGNDLQFLEVGGEPLYAWLARRAAQDWNHNGQLGLVVGATYPREVARVRELAPHLPLLVPGIGAQGGDLQATVRHGRCADGQGLILNSSRAVLYASQGEDFAAAARAEALRTRDAIRMAMG